MNGLFIENLSFAYDGSSRLFTRLGLSVKRGEIAAVSGPNGSGKTTLARLIAGLSPEGSSFGTDFLITFDGKKEFRSAFLPQDLNSHFLYDTIEEETSFFLKYSVFSPGLSAKELSVSKEFEDLLHKKTGSLSNGEKQRYLLSVAGCFSGDKLLVMDEPSAFLDSRRLEVFAGLLGRFKKENYSVLFFGHSFGGFEHLIDSFYEIREGRLFKSEAPQVPAKICFEKRKKGEPVLEAENVSVSDGGSLILKKTGLKLYSGRIKGLSGPNGSGKTTLAKILSGIKEDYSGEIRLKGRLAGPHELRRSVFPALSNPLNQLIGPTVGENLPRRNFSEKEKTDLRSLKLYEKLNISVSRLSYGELQKLVLFSAVLGNPAALIVDEPLPSFDRESESRIFEILNSYALSGGAVLLISHRKELLDGVCDEIYNMEDAYEREI